jgi:isochorismate pyruvate lyase
MIEPEECRTMTEVRAGVDALDEEIVALLARRFRFMDAAARIKPLRSQVRDEERKAAVIEHVRSAAASSGAPGDLIAGVYDRLIEDSIAYELERFDER